ncbi:glycine--tRNA ligase [Candidatus Woesearchaeota archaeon CG10_big_fil_rev_8_21_14_0_10_45_16]|nr:MAG: glycine--tRNA ligase [Candidatus Woesearchaeota archaeon CG10_big_fil_rev_8_21_14_0_10_45_16]
MPTTKELATFFKNKGFIYPSSEIYGGLAGFYDYGHTGTKLKHNFENLWRKYFLSLDDNYFEIDTAQIMHENVFKASGHLENFMDPVAISESGHFERADHLIEKATGKRAEGLSIPEMKEIITKNNIKCPVSGTKIVDVKTLNLMFSVSLGANGSPGYLRPETAQSPYVNFRLQYELQRKKLPLGLALVGKAFRNEISPRNLTLRQREFTQAELQIFFNPAKVDEHPDFSSVKEYPLQVVLVADRESNMTVERTPQMLLNEGLPQFYVYHLVKIQQFYLDTLKISKDKFRLYQLDDKEKAFYNKYHFDIEIELSEHGFTEMGGLHYRTDHDLKGHQEVSKQTMVIHDEESNSKFIPHVLELSFGVDRNVYALLDLNYDNDQERGNAIMHLPPQLAPFFCAVFPLVKNKPDVVKKAKEVQALLKQSFPCYYDESGTVGRRYARADELGVRYCLTVDFDSLDDHSITIRDRETTKQERVPVSSLKERLSQLFIK